MSALNTRLRTACLLLLSTAIVLAVCAVGWTAPRNSKHSFKPGDKVEIAWGGKIVEGEVVEITSSGWVKVRISFNGKEQTPTLPPDEVQPIEKKAGGDRPRKKGELRPGDEVEFEWMGEIRQGTVFSISPHSGWITVRFEDDGKERTTTCTPDQVWPVKKKTTGKGKKPAKDAEGPDESDKRSGSGDGEMRTWTDSTGKFKTEARFLGLEDGNVRLQKADGSIATLPLNKLSEADQWIAKRLAKDMNNEDGDPFATDATTEKKKRGKADDDEEAEEEEEGDEEEEELASGDWSQTQGLVIDAEADGEVAPDAAEAIKIGRLRPFSVRNKNTDVLLRMLLDRPRERLLLASIAREDGLMLRLQFCDLKTAKSTRSLTLDTARIPVDLSPDGTRIVCLRHGLAQRSGLAGVEIWDIEKNGSLLKRWDPSDGSKKKSSVDYARFISPERLLAYCGMSGELTLWEIDGARALYTLATSPYSSPVLSANRKQVAVMTAAGAAILDAASGETLAFLPGGTQAGCSLAFRPDGRQLAALFGDRLFVWDLAKRELVQEIWFPKAVPVSSFLNMQESRLDWLDEDYLLADACHLIDLRKNILLWRYTALDNIHSCAIGDKLCYVTDNLMRRAMSMHRGGKGAGQSNVLFVKLPHPEAIGVEARLSEEELMALKPGGKVSLNIHVPSLNPEELKKITDKYTAQLEANGVSVVSGAPIVLEAAMEQGKTETQTYRRIGRGGEETVTVTEQIYRVSVKENGRTLWERKNSTGGAPMMIFGQEGESLQESVNKQRSSPLNFFLDTKLPKYVARYPEEGVFGISHLTSEGIAPASPDGAVPH